MRVQLTATSLLLPSIVGGTKYSKLVRGGTTRTANDNRSASKMGQDLLWRAPLQVALATASKKQKDRNLAQDNENQEPDVGILTGSKQAGRLLQDTTQDDDLIDDAFLNALDICLILSSTNVTTCDCSQWSGFYGTMTCQVNNGDEYCFNENDNLCATITLNIDSPEGGTLSAEHCINMVRPEEHTYCSQYYMAPDDLLNGGGDFGSAADRCALVVDGTECSSCVMQDCNGLGTSPGAFDCTNTNAGVAGDQCKGDIPFPALEAAVPGSPAASPSASPPAGASPTAGGSESENESPVGESSADKWMAATSLTLVVGAASVFLL
jgi:hypothetical protein